MPAHLVFVSYNHQDREFARRLRLDLESNGLDVWLDEKSIEPGDSIVGKIDLALRDATGFLLILSSKSASSSWVVREYESALAIQLANGGVRPRIIPLIAEDCDVPSLLHPIRWVDFRRAYAQGVTELIRALGVEKPALRSSRLFSEFDQLQSRIDALLKYPDHGYPRFPSHEFFDEAEDVESAFRNLRRWAVDIEPRILERRRYLIYGGEDKPREEQCFDTESFPVSYLSSELNKFAKVVQRFREDSEFYGALSFWNRKVFGASGGSGAGEWYMYCHGTGVFRSAPYEGGEPYVKVGTKVGSGTVLCRIEGEKYDGEMISCIIGGTITAILVNDGDVIDEKTILFRGVVPNNLLQGTS